MSCPWEHLEPASIAFCEERLCAWVREPANTWSNIGYVVVGLVMALGSGRHLPHRRALGGIAVLVGLGSTFFHASATFLGEFVDVGSMFVFAWYWLGALAEKKFALSPGGSRRLALGGLAVSLGALALVHWAGILIFVGLVGGILLFELRLRRPRTELGFPGVRPYLPFWSLTVAFAVAFAFWGLDISGVLCNPRNHILGGHAIWHLSNSLCFLFLARHLTLAHQRLKA